MNFGYISDGGDADFYHCVADGVGRGFIIQTNGEVNAENCIVINCSNNAYYINPANSPTGTRDYNLAYNSTSGNYSTWTKGAHDLEDNPDFVDAAGRDYRLTGGSPCIDAGVAVAGITPSYRGAAPDIGRYEYTVRDTSLLKLLL
jgi:hypothetical protein